MLTAHWFKFYLHLKNTFIAVSTLLFDPTVGTMAFMGGIVSPLNFYIELLALCTSEYDGI